MGKKIQTIYLLVHFPIFFLLDLLNLLVKYLDQIMVILIFYDVMKNEYLELVIQILQLDVQDVVNKVLLLLVFVDLELNHKIVNHHSNILQKHFSPHVQKVTILRKCRKFLDQFFTEFEGPHQNVFLSQDLLKFTVQTRIDVRFIKRFG